MDGLAGDFARQVSRKFLFNGVFVHLFDHFDILPVLTLARGKSAFILPLYLVLCILSANSHESLHNQVVVLH